MSKITPYLWFNNNLEEAVNFYDNVFDNMKIDNFQKTPDGSVLGVSFEIEGQKFIGLNGGPNFTFNESISFFISCKDQEDVDYYWHKLSADGGEEGQCGWLKDKFGLWWQVVPEELPELIGGEDSVKAQAAMNAMLTMKKLDIQLLKDARNNT